MAARRSGEPSPLARRAKQLADWLEALGARGALFVAARLPEPLARRLARALAWAIPRVATRRAEITRVNLRIAFPDWSEEAREHVARESFAHLGHLLVESARIDRMPKDEILARTSVVGAEHLDQALRDHPEGVLVVTGHVGNWELLGPAMALRGYPITVVYRPRENPYVESLLKTLRDRLGLEFIARGNAARGVLRALRSGRVAALPMDQNVHPRHGVFVPFFHRLACTRTGPARIAMRTGAPVVPAFIHRVGDGPNHVIRLHPPLDLVPADSPDAVEENVARITRSIEAAIREAPAQWTWNHRRWKTQPPGEARPYRSKREPGPVAALLRRRPGRARRPAVQVAAESSR